MSWCFTAMVASLVQICWHWFYDPSSFVILTVKGNKFSWTILDHMFPYYFNSRATSLAELPCFSFQLMVFWVSFVYDGIFRILFQLLNMVLHAALHSVMKKYHAASLPSVPSDNEKTGYGRIQLQKSSILFDTLNIKGAIHVAESESPISMESAGQVHDVHALFLVKFIICGSSYPSKWWLCTLLKVSVFSAHRCLDSCYMYLNIVQATMVAFFPYQRYQPSSTHTHTHVTCILIWLL